MEYIKKDGSKVEVDGNILYVDGRKRECVIGANYTNGVIRGGYLSSFNGVFQDELISIESGILNILNTKIGNIKDAYVILKEKVNNIDSNNIYELAHIVFETVDEFFDGINNINLRMNYYYSSDEEESKNNKISNLKGTGAAMCVERAALSQNLLKFLGINSFYKTSGIIINNKKEIHSYNLVEYDDEYYIFDASIPNLINNQINPLISKIDKETFTLLSAPISDIGISTTVSHYNPYRFIDVNITYDSGRKNHIEVDSLSDESIKNIERNSFHGRN